MRHEKRGRSRVSDELTGEAAEDELLQARVPITAHDDKIGAELTAFFDQRFGLGASAPFDNTGFGGKPAASQMRSQGLGGG